MALLHRLGRLQVGEASVLVVVAIVRITRGGVRGICRVV